MLWWIHRKTEESGNLLCLENSRLQMAGVMTHARDLDVMKPRDAGQRIPCITWCASCVQSVVVLSFV